VPLLEQVLLLPLVLGLYQTVQCLRLQLLVQEPVLLPEH
jgi:hypothetical protein